MDEPPKSFPVPGQRLEAPGSEERLRRMRRRFARLHDQIDRATGRRRWILPLLCAATFLAAFVGGLLLLA